MKKLLFFLLLLFVGCNNQEVEVTLWEKYPTKINVFRYGAHIYISFSGNGINGIVHDPECECHYEK